jgi:c-di-GMP-binding flagellar brake protein YcgR
MEQKKGIIDLNKKGELIVTTEGETHRISFEIKGYTSDSVMLDCPQEHKQMLKGLKPGTLIELNMFTHSGVIVLGSQIKETFRDDNVIIDFPHEKKTIQRREFFRVGVQRKIKVRYNDGYHDILAEGKTVDISGGGVRFWTPQHLHVGFMADVEMYIGDLCDYDGTVPAKGRILYTKTHDSLFTTKTGYLSVIKFSEITNKSRQLIMKTCFKLQIDMRKKGIL